MGWILGLLIGAAAFAGAQTVTDTVAVGFEPPGGLALLAITDVAVQLVASETGLALIPGERFRFVVSTGAANGGRLHFTVHGQERPLKVTARLVTVAASGSVRLSVVSGPDGGGGDRGSAVAGDLLLSGTAIDVVTGIGDAYTGAGLGDGYLVRYSLVGNPGFTMGDLVVEYSLVAQ